MSMHIPVDSVIHITASRDQLAKLAVVLADAFQENNYFDMGDTEVRQFGIEIDDNPAVYDESNAGNNEAIYYDAVVSTNDDIERREKPALSICGKCGKSTGCEGDLAWCRTCNADICSDCNCGHNTWGVN